MARRRTEVVEAVGTTGRLSIRRRLVLMTEKAHAIESLPSSEHNAYLREFYRRYPDYPWPSTKCVCARCLMGEK